jgi:hypothetical protein
MFEIIITALSLWLFFGAVKLAFRLTWGAAKITATVLMALAVPVLILCLVFTSGIVILLPAFLIAGAFGILKKCAN